MGIYKIKGSPYWQYDFTVGGSRHRGSTETDSKKQAESIHAKLRSDAVSGVHYIKKDSITLEQAIAKYELNYGQFLKSYENSVKFHSDHLLKTLGKNTLLESIGQEELERYTAKCRTESYRRGKNKADMVAAPATINRRLALFRRIHKLASTSWKVKTQPINFGEITLEEPEAPDNALTMHEAEKLFSLASAHVTRFIIISLYLGWRESGILSLKGSDFDMDKQQVSTMGKSSKPGGKRTTTAMVDAFHNYVLLNKLHEIDGHVITYRGKPIKRIGGKTWKALFETAGIKYRRIHDLRHTFGSWLYAATKDLKLVKEIMNHASITTTMRYTHSDRSLEREKMEGALLPKIRQTKPAGEKS